MINSSSPVSTSIRRATTDDKDQIWAFIRFAYKDTFEYMIPERWKWQYVLNPYRNDKPNLLPIWIAEKENQIVGQICGIPVELKIGDRLLNAAWGVDLIVMPVCRGEGVGTRLIDAMVSDVEQYMAVEMSDITKRIYDRHEYIDIGPVSVHRKIIRIRPSLATAYLSKLAVAHPLLKRPLQMVNSPFLIRPLAFLMNQILRFYGVFSSILKANAQVDIQEVDRFGDEVDELWEETNHEYGIIVKRDQKYLNWRFAENEQLRYTSFLALQNNRVTGYVVLRKAQEMEHNFGYIVDLYAAKNDQTTVEALVRHALDFFGDEVDLIECACSLEKFTDVLKRFGFIEMRQSIPYAKSTDQGMLSRLRSLKNDWFITAGDSDWDQLTPVDS